MKDDHDEGEAGEEEEEFGPREKKSKLIKLYYDTKI
jgi:hypothetical protein